MNKWTSRKILYDRSILSSGGHAFNTVIIPVLHYAYIRILAEIPTKTWRLSQPAHFMLLGIHRIPCNLTDCCVQTVILRVCTKVCLFPVSASPIRSYHEPRGQWARKSCAWNYIEFDRSFQIELRKRDFANTEFWFFFFPWTNSKLHAIIWREDVYLALPHIFKEASRIEPCYP